MKTGRKLKRPEKLNLVPILDSVFIFIFFLLMSAQFVDVYEIGASAPVVKEVKDDKSKLDPLNLTLELSREQVVVKTGLRFKRSRTFAIGQKKEIREFLVELKRRHPQDNSMILKADPKISYQGLVTFIDSTQGSQKNKNDSFTEIVFDYKGVH